MAMKLLLLHVVSRKLKFEAILLVFLISWPLFTLAMVQNKRATSFDIADLVGRSLDLLNKSSRSQIFIGIAGGPGSGKTTIATHLCEAINEKANKCMSIVIPMDGYHFSKKELKQMGTLGKIIGDPEATTGHSTSYEDLMRRRGAPWTFDSKSLFRDLKAAKEKGEGAFPTYSREISDPVPGGVTLARDHKIVICEGLYLLAFDSPDWAPLKEIWDEAWYVSVPEAIIEERLVSRHLENWTDQKRELWGDGQKGAKAKVGASDIKNLKWLHEMSKSHADLTIENYDR